MKKLLVLNTLMLCSVCSFSQNYFTLGESGLFPSANKDAKYIVIDKEGTQTELFNTIKSFVNNFFVSPKDVISEVNNDMITINGVSTKDIVAKKGFGYVDIKMNYTIVFHFKDGKIRIDVPSINSMTGESRTLGGQLGSLYVLTYTKSDHIDGSRDRIIIFDKGKVKNQYAKDNIEQFFNNFIDKALKYKNPTTEKW